MPEAVVGPGGSLMVPTCLCWDVLSRGYNTNLHIFGCHCQLRCLLKSVACSSLLVEELVIQERVISFVIWTIRQTAHVVVEGTVLSTERHQWSRWMKKRGHIWALCFEGREKTDPLLSLQTLQPRGLSWEQSAQKLSVKPWDFYTKIILYIAVQANINLLKVYLGIYTL